MTAREALRRLEKLETGSDNDDSYVLSLIDSGRCYEDLSDAERQAYDAYWGTSFDALRKAYNRQFGFTKTKLSRKTGPSFALLDAAFDAMSAE